MSDILSLLQDFDVANFLPAPDQYVAGLSWWARLIVLAAPLLLLVLGLIYRYRPLDGPQRRLSFRTFHPAGSIEAWRFAQRTAGVGYTLVGGALSVVVLVVSLFFNGRKAMTMANIVLVCMILELIIIVALQIAINILVMKAYDKDGRRCKGEVKVFQKGMFSRKK